MAGLTANARPKIISRHPASMQVSYLGFIGSSAIDGIDYLLTTEDLFAKEFAYLYTEKPLYLPCSYVAINSANKLTQISDRLDYGLPQDAFVFCALLNSYKITESVFSEWIKIMKLAENSVLWLIEESPKMRENLIKFSKNQGLNTDRLFFSHKISPLEYRARLQAADLFLDTSPYSNGATAHDAILSGLPVLTCPGKTMMSRFSGHLMKQLGLNELVAQDWLEYRKIAVDFATNPKKFAEVREKLLVNIENSDLFNIQRFAIDFGNTLKTTYRNRI